MDKLTIYCNSLSETQTLAGCFAKHLKAGLVVGLNGPLGAGKSAFARFVIKAVCGQDQDVPSPTFTLAQSYETHDGLPLMHMDLYRLEAAEDVFELGVEDSFFTHANLVEWPSKMGRYWPETAVSIMIEFMPQPSDDDERKLTFTGPRDFLASLAAKAAKVRLRAG